MSTVSLNQDELNTVLSAIGLALNFVKSDGAARKQLEELQTKLMAIRDGKQ